MKSITYSQKLSQSTWQICDEKNEHQVPFAVPGDVHSALLNAGNITDPYWRDQEMQLDWVHERAWIATTQFQFEGDLSKRHILRFETIDCFADIYLNDQTIGHCNSQFLRWDFDVTSALLVGENELKIHFHSNSAIAAQMAQNQQDKHGFAVPFQTFNNRLPHYNYLRKTQCHAGWDWNIALSPIGIYGDVTLVQADPLLFEDMMVRQHHQTNGDVALEIELFFESLSVTKTKLAAEIAGVKVEREIEVYPGKQSAKLHLTVPSPERWWPNGYGAQTLYDLSVTLDAFSVERKIGFREITLDTNQDEIGNRFQFIVNGVPVFAKGANWIPADALPQNVTKDVVRDRLQSALDANMNMIRVWGGGQYEPDWFYDLCGEMGILVWQDFMFACNLYPAHDREWLRLVREEAAQQIKRLSSHAAMALWCGDNELVGALTWYPESQQNRDRYLAIYDRLNHALEEAIDTLQPDIAFWPSSPSAGRLDYADAWHHDRSGDMHFWDVWHSSKDFEHYRTVRPRFCSEFGFQSFPSMSVIESFTAPDDRNVSSKVMDVHQRNPGGNSRIVETISRYFRFPERFEDMVYVSQISQALAMQTAIEFWRANAPRTMGTLYWQLNDTWPVASWASLEYGGNWKLTHYLARRFFAPILVTAQPNEETGDIEIFAIADQAQTEQIKVRAELVSTKGDITLVGDYEALLEANKPNVVHKISAGDVPDDCFLHLSWFSHDGQLLGENDYLPHRPKHYAFQTPNIDVAVSHNGHEVTLSTDQPALYVTYDHGSKNIYSDNCFTLLPGRPKTIKLTRERGDALDQTHVVQWLNF